MILALLLLCALPRYPLATASDPHPLMVVVRTSRCMDRTGVTVKDSTSAAARRLTGAEGDTAVHMVQVAVGVQRRAIDWYHPRYSPDSVAVSPWVAAGATCTLYVAHQQPGDVLVARARNLKGPGLWFGPWKPVAAWGP